MAFKKVEYKRWWIGLVIAILFVGFGIYMIVNAFNVSKLIIRIIGAILIVDAISDLWVYFCYKKYQPTGGLKSKDIKEISDVKEANIIAIKEK